MIRRAFLLILVISLLLIPIPVESQSQIAAQATFDVDFPLSITFNLQAESNSDITRIVLQYQVDKQLSCAHVTSIAFPDFEPGASVQTSWTWDMIKSGGLPPGTQVYYSWIIVNEDGDELITEWETLCFDDDRYDWHSVIDGNLEILWYSGTQEFAQELMDAANDALVRLEASTGATLERSVRIYIYPNAYDLQGAMIYPQEWTGGVAFTEHGVIAIGISIYNLEWGKNAIAHELAHMVIHQITFNCYNQLPTWLDEGLAMYAQEERDPSYEAALNEAIAEGGLFSVRTLSSSFPASPQAAALSYAESYSIVGFLIQEYGQEKMLELLLVFHDGCGYDEALMEVYGFDMDGLDALWRESIGALVGSIP